MTRPRTRQELLGCRLELGQLTGPDVSGDPMIAKARHVVVHVGDLPAELPVLDRYSGEYLPKGNDHPEAAPIKPYIYAPDSSEPPSM
jgi:hypothetical protein